MKARQQVVSLVERCTQVATESSVVGDDVIEALMEHVRLHLPDFIDYFTQHVIGKLRNNVEVLRSQSWIARAWTNNNAESYNHVLKTKLEWRQMRNVSDLIDSIHGLVQLQIKDLRRALRGDGNFNLTGTFVRHRVTYQAWLSKSEEQKMTLFTRFVSDSGNRQPPVMVQSTDGGLRVLNSTTVARKPGQQKRSRAVRTATKPAGRP